MNIFATLLVLALSSGASAASQVPSDIIDLSKPKNSQLLGFKMLSMNNHGEVEFLRGDRFIVRSTETGNKNICAGRYKLGKRVKTSLGTFIAEKGDVMLALFDVKCTGLVFPHEKNLDPVRAADREELPILLTFPDRIDLSNRLFDEDRWNVQANSESLSPRVFWSDGEALHFSRVAP